MDLPDLAKFLYESLPEALQSRVLVSKRVIDVAVSEDGVKVACDDGTTHEGSIVVGADGVRSTVRLFVRALRAEKSPEDMSYDQANPYTTTYRLLFGSIPILPGLSANTRYDGTRCGLCTQIINGADRAWFGIYEALDALTSAHSRYSEADRTDMLARWGHLYMAPGWTVHDVHTRRLADTDTELIDLQEGSVNTPWYFKRTVIVGDAIRKLEPHAGLGYNGGVADLIVLANGLRRLLQDHKHPST